MMKTLDIDPCSVHGPNGDDDITPTAGYRNGFSFFCVLFHLCVVFLDQELVDAAAWRPGRRCMCTHQAAALFYVK